MTDVSEFLNKNKFSKMVEETVQKNKMSYIDAVISICDNTSIEPEDAGKYISNILKCKIEAEARNLNFLPKQNTLPL